MWSFTSLCKLLISDDSGKLSPFSSEASLPLHDVLLLGKPSHIEWDIKRQSSFQVNMMTYSLDFITTGTETYIQYSNVYETHAG